MQQHAYLESNYNQLVLLNYMEYLLEAFSSYVLICS
jgi:hypothetical protein